MIRCPAKKTESFSGLFYSLLAMFVIVPFFQGYALAEEISVSVFSLIVLGTLYAFYGSHIHFRRIAWLAAATLVSNIVAYLTPYVLLDNLSLAFNMAFFGFAIAMLFRSIFRNRQVTLNIILGAVCVYLLIGVTWGMGYALLDTITPHSFQMAPVDTVSTQMDGLVQHFIYFSFATLSTLGYGDITPLSTPARYFATLEAITGQIYLSVLVARLVGMHLVQK